VCGTHRLPGTQNLCACGGSVFRQGSTDPGGGRERIHQQVEPGPVQALGFGIQNDNGPGPKLEPLAVETQPSISPELAAGIRRVKGVRRIGVRVGNWLTAEQGKRLLTGADCDSLRGKRNYAILAMLIGCGLRRGELLALPVDAIQLREEHWVIADLLGKAGHIRTVPIPKWVKEAVDAWKEASGITEGALFRSINKTGRVWGNGMTPKVLWEVVREAASRAGIEKLAPHDLRRTCARLCHLAGGELDQIQFLLGHVSIQTTERYLGCKQKLRDAVNDRMGIEPEANR